MDGFDYKSDPKRLLLYHHTTAQTAVERILSSRTLRLGPLKNTNDLKESRTWLFGFGTSSDFHGFTDDLEKQLQSEAAMWLQGTTKLLCMSKDDELQREEGEAIYGCGFCLPRMWAQYGDLHRGVCLIFDRLLLTEKITQQLDNRGLLKANDVEYRDEPIWNVLRDRTFILSADIARERGTVEAVSSHLAEKWREMYFRKSCDWRDEREFRWIFNDGDSKEQFIRFEESLVGVVLGADYDGDSWGREYDYRINFGVDAASLHWRNGVPGIMPPVEGPWVGFIHD